MRGTGVPQDEVRAARAGAALFARGDAGLVAVTGADRVRWLDGMLSNDVARLEPGPERSGCPALLLTRKGRIVADPHVLLRPDALWLAVARDAVPAVIATRDRFIVADRVERSDGSDAWDRLALEGPAAPSLLESAAGAPPDLAAGAGADAQLAGIPVVVAAFGVTISRWRLRRGLVSASRTAWRPSSHIVSGPARRAITMLRGSFGTSMVSKVSSPGGGRSL